MQFSTVKVNWVFNKSMEEKKKKSDKGLQTKRVQRDIGPKYNISDLYRSLYDHMRYAV